MEFVEAELNGESQIRELSLVEFEPLYNERIVVDFPLLERRPLSAIRGLYQKSQFVYGGLLFMSAEALLWLVTAGGPLVLITIFYGCQFADRWMRLMLPKIYHFYINPLCRGFYVSYLHVCLQNQNSRLVVMRR